MDLVKPAGEKPHYYPTKKELTVTNFLTGLRKLKNSDHVTIMGDEAWLRFRILIPIITTTSDYIPIVHFSSL